MTQHSERRRKRPSPSQERAVGNDGFEESFRRDYPLLWLMTLIGPFVLTVVLVLLLAMVWGPHRVGQLLGTSVVTFFFLGKFVILAGIDHSSEVPQFLTPFELFLMVLYMDLMVALVLVFHTGFLFKIPYLGSRLRDLVDDGRFILQSNPWMRQVTFLGIIAFVMFPLSATGSVGGSIFGRLLGMGRLATFVGISIGSVLGCALMYYGAGAINRYVGQDNPLLKISGFLVVIGLVVLLNLRYRRLKEGHQRAMNERLPEGALDEST
ncbi:hypothetical protein Pan216_57450 [Planctomycetes bacterium Pan216]|uniref:Small multi-drug export protein n=1 Tax=Kolteria novifilia TaxID=2527975 RepID=A0A518BCZ3_9BACT|nr:hypothetical protein Pan216_57450 [Planctomycetes bacterium Pan216]